MSDYDLPLAKRYLDIMMPGRLCGGVPEVQEIEVIAEFNDLYPLSAAHRCPRAHPARCAF
jgi:hypothetical protein